MLRQHFFKPLQDLLQTPKIECILCQYSKDGISVEELLDYGEDTTQLSRLLDEFPSKQRSSHLVALLLQATTSSSKKELLMSLSEHIVLDTMEETHGLLERANNCPVCMSDPLAGQTTRLLRRLLVKLSKTTQTVPRSFLISGVHLQCKYAVSGGGFADIFRGMYQGQLVALKRLRNTMARPVSAAEESVFRREALVSWFLQHPNIQPFIGVDQTTFSLSISLVSPWQPNGNILGWLVYCDTLGLPILVDEYIRRILSGMDYLHDNGIIHGDLRGANVLIDSHCSPRLADFGLSTLHGAGYSTVGARSGGTTRFMAPELLLGEKVQISFGADIYAFACVCLELHTRQHPFPDIMFDQQVISAVLRGSRPSKPSEPTNSLDGFWETLEQCWNPAPLLRPSVQSLASSLPLRRPTLSLDNSATHHHVTWKVPAPKSPASGGSTGGRHSHRDSSCILDSCLLGFLDLSAPDGKTFHEAERFLATLGCPQEVARIVRQGRADEDAFVTTPVSQSATTTIEGGQATTQTMITAGVDTDESAPAKVAAEHAASFYDRGCQAMGRRSYKAAADYFLRDTEVHRDPAQRNPDRFNPLLARSLHNLAFCLSKCGEFKDAVMHGQQAADLLMGLARDKPAKFNPNLALSLNNLASDIYELGEVEDAMLYGRQAVNLQLDFAREKPDEFNPLLASSLHNLAWYFHQLREFNDAVVYGRQAVDLRWDLSQEKPDEFDPLLALSLHNLAWYFSQLGQFEDAVKYSRQAVDLRQDLAQNKAGEFNSCLSLSLHFLAWYFSQLGEFQDAMVHGQQAVDLRRDLAQETPDEFNPLLALSLHNLASYFSQLGEFKDAVVYSQQAVHLLRDLVEKNPDVFNKLLASSLHTLAASLSELEEFEDAVMYGLQAVNLRRDLVQEHPDEYKPLLAESLDNLASDSEHLGHHEDVVKFGREASVLYRILVHRRPEERHRYVKCLRRLATSLNVLDLVDEARRATQEAEMTGYTLHDPPR